MGIEIRKSSADAMGEIYGQVEALLSEMKMAHEKELGVNNATIQAVAAIRTECEDLLKQI